MKLLHSPKGLWWVLRIKKADFGKLELPNLTKAADFLELALKAQDEVEALVYLRKVLGMISFNKVGEISNG